jgi:hypothetical protein
MGHTEVAGSVTNCIHWYFPAFDPEAAAGLQLGREKQMLPQLCLVKMPF